jgi:hypothetical protein
MPPKVEVGKVEKDPSGRLVEVGGRVGGEVEVGKIDTAIRTADQGLLKSLIEAGGAQLKVSGGTELVGNKPGRHERVIVVNVSRSAHG